MYHVPLAVKCIYGCSNEGGKNEDGKEGRELGLPGLLYADNLILYSKSEEDLRAMVGSFVSVWEVLLVCRRRSLKANKAKSKVMMLNGEEGLE